MYNERVATQQLTVKADPKLSFRERREAAKVSDRDRSKKRRKVVERESCEPSKLTDTILSLAMENNTEVVGLNKSLFFIQPHSDPELVECTGFYLKSDLAHLLEWKFWISGVMSSVLISLGTLGNFLAIFLLQKPKMKSAFNQLLITLCVIDTIFLISNIPNIVLALGSRALSPITSTFNVLGHVSVTASIFMIVALSYERHFAICSPHAYRIHLRTVPRWKHLVNYIVPVVLVAVFFNIPMFINLQKEMMKNALYVKINLYLRGVHPLTSTGLMPMFLLIFLNVRISSGIKKLRKPRPIHPVNPEITGLTDLNRRLNQGSSNKRHAKEIRATYLSLVIVVTFTVLNLPRIVASTLEVTNTNLIIFCVENEVRYVPSIDFYKLDFFARLFMVVNSALNFIIYCAVSTPFQEAFLECLCPCYAWLKPWFCSITSTTPNTEEEEDDLEDEEENAIHDHQLEELQRRLQDKDTDPIINPESDKSDKITAVVISDHQPISENPSLNGIVSVENGTATPV